MSFLSHWQPLRNEDAHTALVFGFLRHAPTEAALDAWLTGSLGRPVSARPLERSGFWPTLSSVIGGSQYTEPELVIAADDGVPLAVVVEVKPGYDMFTIAQLSREVIDVAHETGVHRIACVMVGADLGPPASSGAWEEQIRVAARAQLPHPVEISLHYSSFAALGRVVANCGRVLPDWAPYAADVNAQLRRKGLMGYEGGPMFDDLEGLTLPNAVELFNRAIRAARQFYLQLHGQAAFTAMGYTPPPGWSYRMLRDDPSQTLTEDEMWFTTTVLLSQYAHKSFPDGTRAFIAFDLLGTGTRAGTGESDILAGRVSFTSANDLGAGWFASAIRQAAQVHRQPPWSERAAFRTGEWLFDRRPWHPGKPDEDISWALTRLAAARGE